MEIFGLRGREVGARAERARRHHLAEKLYGREKGGISGFDGVDGPKNEDGKKLDNQVEVLAGKLQSENLHGNETFVSQQ